MLRCGYCEVICESYEDWLSHLVSPDHQANFGVNEIFINHNKDPDRNERSVLVSKMNPTTEPYEVICHFASIEPLGFVTDAFIHMFQNVNEKFYLIVYDQQKFVDRIIHLQEKCGEQKVLSSIVRVEKKSQLTAQNWTERIDSSFFYRRHEHVKRKLNDMSWDNQLNSLLKQVSLNQEGYTAREKIMEELESLIRMDCEECHEAVMHPFGSCTTWLADMNADLDIFVDIAGDGGRMDKDRDTKLDIMSKVTRILRKKYGGDSAYKIQNARVPIVVLSHPSGLKVDLSFENILSVQNSSMIRLLTRFDYRIRPLLIFLRYWARFHNLIGPHSIKSYALILMAFVYLRQLKLIPSVHELQTVAGTKNIPVCGWNAGFCQSRECAKKHYTWLKCVKEGDPNGLAQQVIKLAHGFFKEYSELDYSTQVICPLIGGYLPKVLFQSPNGANLSSEFQLYKANLSTAECFPFNTDKLICIQDPFALNVNVTASCRTDDILHTFKAGCAMAVEVLQPYVATYDSCGTVNILELCCQPVPFCKIEEEKKKRDDEALKRYEEEKLEKEKNKSENMEDGYEFLNDDDTDKIWENAVIETRRSRTEEQVQNWSSATRVSGSRWDRRERVDRKNDRVVRVPLYDGNEMFVSNMDGGGHGQEDTMEEAEGDNGKTMKSVIVVPSDNVKRDLLDQKYTSSTEDSRKQKPSTSGSSSKPTVSETVSKENILPSAPSPIVKFLSTPELSLHLHKDPPQQVKYVESNMKAYTSLLVPYSDSFDESDKKEAEEKTTKQVKEPHVAPATPQANSFGYERTVIHIPKQPNSNSKSPNSESPKPTKSPKSESAKPTKSPNSESPKPTNSASSAKSTNSSATAKSDNSVSVKSENNDSEISSKEKPAKSTNFPPKAQTAPIEDTTASASSQKSLVKATKSKSEVNVPSAGINNTTRNSTKLQEIPEAQSRFKTKIYKKLRVRKPVVEDEIDIVFPLFGCYISEEYIDEFYKVVGPVVTPTNSELVDMKSKILWVNYISDLFLEQHFWSKFSIVLEDVAYRKLDKNQLNELNLLITDYRFVVIHSDSDSRKRINSFSSSTSGEPGSDPGRNKVMKMSSNTDITTYRGEENRFVVENPYTNKMKEAICSQLSKVPANIRKTYGLTYCITCFPSKIYALYTEWNKIAAELKLQPYTTNKEGLLDLFGKYCIYVSRTVRPDPGEETCEMQMVLLFETGSDSPVVYFGFPKLVLYDEDCTEEECQLIPDMSTMMEAIIKGLVSPYITQRIHKYFK
ncbi:unnamed protein product [Orchesella dallaii]|uniref:Speckle targeted PIP5K1A-regulated poly(A) polymerase n=1 Tax=Orchesella dallaii TaxID=48710 RepID=A0ABP1PT42_9HEXA